MATQAVSGNSVGKIGLGDAPAVELALSRSKLYLLLSWGFLYPEEEEFYNYLQEGEFVEDGLAAIETLEKSLEATKATAKVRDGVAARNGHAPSRILVHVHHAQAGRAVAAPRATALQSRRTRASISEPFMFASPPRRGSRQSALDLRPGRGSGDAGSIGSDFRRGQHPLDGLGRDI